MMFLKDNDTTVSQELPTSLQLRSCIGCRPFRAVYSMLEAPISPNQAALPYSLSISIDSISSADRSLSDLYVPSFKIKLVYSVKRSSAFPPSTLSGAVHSEVLFMSTLHIDLYNICMVSGNLHGVSVSPVQVHMLLDSTVLSLSLNFIQLQA